MAKPPIYVRSLNDEEQVALVAGLRAREAFVMRRCQILLASAAGKRASQIGAELGCDADTVLDAINAFNQRGLEALVVKSCRPKKTREAFGAEQRERLREMLHHSPRDFGRSTSLWTLALAAEVSLEQGLTTERVTGETVRMTLQRLGVRWKRAKQWITSPDPAYERKKKIATG